MLQVSEYLRQGGHRKTYADVRRACGLDVWHLEMFMEICVVSIVDLMLVSRQKFDTVNVAVEYRGE